MKKIFTVVALSLTLIIPTALLTGCSSDNTTGAANGIIADIQGDVQTVTMDLRSKGYEEITVQKGVPVEWTINADKSALTGCNSTIVIPDLDIEKELVEGANVIEFTPTESGNIPYSCWMGMISSNIYVVDDISATSSTDSGATGVTDKNTYNAQPVANGNYNHHEANGDYTHHEANGDYTHYEANGDYTYHEANGDYTNHDNNHNGGSCH